MSKPELIAKLASELAKKGIIYTPNCPLGRNAVFTSKDYEKKISHDLFYRVSGINSYKVDVGEHEFKMVPMTDKMFYLSWLRAVIEYSFDPKNRK